MVDGRQDYRGISYPHGYQLIGKTFVSTDLGKAGFGENLWLQDCFFDHCSFERADCSNMAEQGNTFADCTFDRTEFRGAGLGYRGSRYRSCLFKRCDFSRASFIRAEFDDCQFIDCKLNGMDFGASSFVRCEFRGRLVSVWFRGDFPLASYRESFGIPRPNTMADVSFEHAELVDVVFTNGCPLDKVKIPRGDNYLLVDDLQKKLTALQSKAPTFGGRIEREIGLFARVHLVHAKYQTQSLLNLDDIVRDYGMEAAEVIWAELKA
jgi:uncharacterized protein YjbI with pentapeptide repeats